MARPITTFLGPFGRAAQWIAEFFGLTGNFYVGFKLEVAAVGDITRSEEAVYSAGFDATLTFAPNCSLEVSAGPRKLTAKLEIAFELKLRISPNDKGQGCVKGVISGSIQIGFTIEYQKEGSPVRKLVNYKPEWAKWPKGDAGLTLKEFIVF